MSSRKAAFTSFEKELLKEILAPYINVLESKRTDADFNKKKAEIWAKVAEKFNLSPQVQHATNQQLKKLWLNMKARARDAKSLEKQRTNTGGGPHIPDMDPDHEAVLSMVPHLMPTIKVVKDSDGPGEKEDTDDDDVSWKPKKARISPYRIEIYLPEVDNEITVSSKRDDHCYDKVSVTSTITSATEKTTDTVASIQSKSCTTASSASKPTPRKKLLPSKSSSIDALKAKLIEQDIEQRRIRFEKKMMQLDQELLHKRKMQELQYNLLLLEYEHKKSLYEIELKKAQQ